MNFRKSLIFTILALGLIVAACSSSNDNSNNGGNSNSDGANAVNDDSTPVEGGDLIMAIPEDVTDLDAHGASARRSGTVKLNIYETLVAPDEDMHLQPLLAESYELVEDNIWEFKLREGIIFHDGAEFNAEAVKANMDRVLDPEVASAMANQFNMVAEVEVVDEYTVRFILEQPFQSFPNNLSHWGGGMISPKAIEQDYAGEINLETNPVGTGPFKFEKWDQGNEVVLVKNEDYWGDIPYLDTLTYKVVPEQSTRIGMLETGEAHIVDAIQPANAERVNQIDGAQFLAAHSMRSNFLGFNTEKEPFDDKRVRQAIAMAVDIETLVEGVYEGYAKAAVGPITEDFFGFNDEMDRWPYDIDAAKELLAEAGYADGFSTNIWASDAEPIAVQTAEYFQHSLSELGIDVEIIQSEWGAHLSETGEGKHDMFALGWSNNLGDPNDSLYRQFHSDNFGAAGNRYFYKNDKVDDLLINARSETDDNERERMYQEVQTILMDEIPRIDVSNPNYTLGIADSVKGFVQLPSEHHSFRTTYLAE